MLKTSTFGRFAVAAILSACTLFFSAAQCQAWADIYIRAAAGADNGGTDFGTQAAPYRNFTAAGLAATAIAAGTFGSGDTLYLAGEFFATSDLTLTGKTNVTIKQWPGQDPAIIRRDVAISTAWTNLGTDWASCANIGTGLGVASVTWNYERNVDRNGRRMPFLRLAASAAAVQNTNAPWSYFYDTGTGVVTINIPGIGANKPDSTGINARVTWGTEAGNTGILLTACTNCVVDGIAVQLVDPSHTGGGYGIRAPGCNGTIVRNCVVRDCGYHGIGFLGGGSNNVIEDCELWGGSTGSTNVVWYGDDIANPVVSGARIRRCAIHVYTMLRPDGTSLYTGPAVATGVYAHNNKYPFYTTNLEVSDCVIKGYSQIATTGTSAGGRIFTVAIGVNEVDGTAATNEYDASQYPIRVRDCILDGGALNLYNASVLRCVISGETLSVASPWSIARDAGWMAPSQRRNLLFDSCDISHIFKYGDNASGYSGAFVNVPSPTVPSGLTALVYTNATRTFTRAAAATFPQHLAPGDTVVVSSGTNMTPATYIVESMAADLKSFVVTASAGTGDSVNAVIGNITSVNHDWGFLFVNCTLTMNTDFGMTFNGSDAKNSAVFFFYNHFGTIPTTLASRIRIRADRCIFQYSSPAPLADHLLLFITGSTIAGNTSAEFLYRFQFTNCNYFNFNSTRFAYANSAYVTQANWTTNNDPAAVYTNPGIWSTSSGEPSNGSRVYFSPVAAGLSGVDIRKQGTPGYRGAYRTPNLSGLRGVRNASQPLWRNPSAAAFFSFPFLTESDSVAIGNTDPKLAPYFPARTTHVLIPTGQR